MAIELIFKHFWIPSVAVTLATAIIWRIRGQKYISENPGLKEGYQSLTRGLIIWGNIPWLVMGAGVVFGGVPTFFQYLRPQDLDPFVLAFWGSVTLIQILALQWIFFRDGAEMLTQHPGLLDFGESTPSSVKTYCALAIAGGVLALVMLIAMDIPLPKWTP